MLTRKDLLAHIAAREAAHDAERAAWAEERRLLVNMVVSDTASEFAVRQRVSEPAAERERPEPKAAQLPVKPLGL